MKVFEETMCRITLADLGWWQCHVVNQHEILEAVATNVDVVVEGHVAGDSVLVEKSYLEAPVGIDSACYHAGAIFLCADHHANRCGENVELACGPLVPPSREISFEKTIGISWTRRARNEWLRWEPTIPSRGGSGAENGALEASLFLAEKPLVQDELGVDARFDCRDDFVLQLASRSCDRVIAWRCCDVEVGHDAIAPRWTGSR